MASNADFLSTLARWTQKPGDLSRAVAKTFADVSGAIIKATPVSEEFGGAARGGWIPSIGSPDLSGQGNPDNSGSATANNAVIVSDSFSGDGSLFLTNNIPYIRVLEYGGYPTRGGSGASNGPRTVNGYSKQAPSGMVRINVEKFNDALKKNLGGV